jgi:hypothetical protein
VSYDPLDVEYDALRALFDDIMEEHTRLKEQPFNNEEYDRHRARLRALIDAIHEWRAKQP